MQEYLTSSQYIDWDNPFVLERARRLAEGRDTLVEVARACYLFVRDEIAHSGDEMNDVVTCSASQVLWKKTGWCFAKSHLLAALLRANQIPAALCYQRLARKDGACFSIHGLNSIYLADTGWYRCDPRGNRADLAADFCPPLEKLAWPGDAPGELNIPGLYAEPLPQVIACLTRSSSFRDVCDSLPDIT